MGLSIHYRGRLADIRQIKSVCEILTDIAEEKKWKIFVLNEDWTLPADPRIVFADNRACIDGHLPLKGVSLNIASGAETLCFFFDAEGNLRDPMSLTAIAEGSLKPEEAWLSVKTQFAPPEAHLWIIFLLKYLKKYYIPDLEVHDEGEYWETGSFDRLKEKLKFIADKTDAVSDVLSRISRDNIPGCSGEELADRIEDALRKKFD